VPWQSTRVVPGEKGLITAKVMTSDSLLEDVFDRTLENSREALGEKGPHLASVTLPVVGGGVGFAQEEEHGLGWSTGFQRLVRQITDSRSGVFIAVDEVHQSQIAQLRKLFGTYQIMVSSGLNVALAVSGLLNAVSDVPNDEVLTFLQRMTQYVLSDVSLKDVGIALRKTIEEGGRSIAAGDLEAATQATLGYPFMIQLVGYHVWRQNPDARAISSDDVAAGIARPRPPVTPKTGLLARKMTVGGLTGTSEVESHSSQEVHVRPGALLLQELLARAQGECF
jgi:hypothetical protein